MVDYSNVIQVGAAMLAIILIGFLLAKFKILTPLDSAPVNKMVLYVGYIPLVARAIAPRSLPSLDFQPFGIAALLAIGTYIVGTVIFIFPLKDRFGTYLSIMLPSTYINYIISGIPIFNSLWPPEENVMVSMMTLANDLIAAPIYLTLVGFYNISRNNVERVAQGLEKEHFTFKMILTIVIKVITAPILIGNILGIIYAATTLPVVPFLRDLMQYLGDMVFGLALLCVGVFLAQHSLLSCHWLEFASAVIFRFFIGSIIAGLFCVALGMSPRVSRQCMIIGAQPTAVASFLLAAQNNLGIGVASTCIFWTTVLTVPVIILWFAILDGLNIFVETSA